MRSVQTFLVVAALTTIATLGSAPVQSVEAAANSGLESFAQAEQQPVTTRVKTWTRARLAAAQKQWALNKEKFSDCSKQLGDQKKTKRISIHDQGHFLDACMKRSP
jgi:hypothetical protein